MDNIKTTHAPRIRMAAAVCVLLLGGWACGSDVASQTPRSTPSSDVTEPSPEHRASPAAAEHSSTRQPGAEDMRVAIVSPADSASFSGNSLSFNVDVNGFALACDRMGKGDASNQGHLHVYLDDVLVNYFCTPQFTISLQNKQPGTHSLRVVPAENSHREVKENAETIQVDWQPTSPPPIVQPARFTSDPTVQILDPQPDAAIADTTKVRINVKSFNLSCDLMGKDGVDGYGHWHAHLATSGTDHDQGSLLQMGCEEEFTLSTAGLQKGAIYTLVVQLTENGHAPIDGASDEIQIRIA